MKRFLLLGIQAAVFQRNSGRQRKARRRCLTRAIAVPRSMPSIRAVTWTTGRSRSRASSVRSPIQIAACHRRQAGCVRRSGVD